MVFQDPGSSLNPRRQVGSILAELLRAHRVVPRSEIPQRTAQLLSEVGLSSDVVRALPHELSGGQRQRVSIARALALEPDLLIADEVTSALDVSIQAQVLNLLLELQASRNLTMIFISHDLGLVRIACSHVAVMSAGEIVEKDTSSAVFTAPRHPYTRRLIAASPTLEIAPGPPERRATPQGTPTSAADIEELDE